MVSRQEALFGIVKIAYARMADIAQHLHLMKKLGKGGGGLSAVVFSKSSQNISLKIYQIFWGNGEFTGKTINAGKKKPAELYTLPA